MSRAIDSIHLKNPIFCFIFNRTFLCHHHHCRYARLPEVWLNLHEYPLRYNQKFIIAILHLLLLLVVVVVVFSFNKRNSKTVRGIYKAETLHNDHHALEIYQAGRLSFSPTRQVHCTARKRGVHNSFQLAHGLDTAWK